MSDNFLLTTDIKYLQGLEISEAELKRLIQGQPLHNKTLDKIIDDRIRQEFEEDVWKLLNSAVPVDVDEVTTTRYMYETTTTTAIHDRNETQKENEMNENMNESIVEFDQHIAEAGLHPDSIAYFTFNKSQDVAVKLIDIFIILCFICLFTFILERLFICIFWKKLWKRNIKKFNEKSVINGLQQVGQETDNMVSLVVPGRTVVFQAINTPESLHRRRSELVETTESNASVCSVELCESHSSR